MSSVIITVVVVLGIIVAGGFLLYFMSDLFISLAHKNRDESAISKKQQEETADLKKRVDALEKADQIKKDPEIATILYNGANDGVVVEDYNPEAEAAAAKATEEAEETNEEETEEETEETPAEESDIEEIEETEETEEEKDEDDDTTDFIKQRRQELMERLARMQRAQEESEEETEEDDNTVDLTEESEETETEETTEETEEAPAAEETKETPAQDEVKDAVAENVYEEVKNDSNALAAAMPLEELEAKLAEEQERLKANEKELRKCKKEFIPLRRIKKTLDSDKKKLQRKEALVAKQKTVLYGVNNYADLDEEKAKKLAEDLDLYDGLKLSVQHCEEVMEKNADRYPLLEQIFNLLTSQNAEIKEDIKNLQEAIDSLKADDNADDTADAE